MRLPADFLTSVFLIDMSILPLNSTKCFPEFGYLNIKVSIFWADKNVFHHQTKDLVFICIMATPIMVQKIRSSKYVIDKYIIVFIGLADKNPCSTPAMARFWHKIYLVYDIKANILLRSDISSLKKFLINLEKKKSLIKSYRISILNNITFKNNIPAIQRDVHIHKVIPFSYYFILSILIHHFNIPNKWDYLFKLININFFLYTQLIEVKTSSIIFWNNTAIVV